MWFNRGSAILLSTLGLCIFLCSLRIMSSLRKVYPNVHTNVLVETLGFRLLHLKCHKIPFIALGIAMPMSCILIGTMWCVLSPTPGISGLFGACGMLIFLSVKCLADAGSSEIAVRGKAF